MGARGPINVIISGPELPIHLTKNQNDNAPCQKKEVKDEPREESVLRV
jgi:hypothetical protein